MTLARRSRYALHIVDETASETVLVDHDVGVRNSVFGEQLAERFAGDVEAVPADDDDAVQLEASEKGNRDEVTPERGRIGDGILLLTLLNGVREQVEDGVVTG